MATQMFICLETDALQPVPKMAIQAVWTQQNSERFKFLQGSSRMQTITSYTLHRTTPTMRSELFESSCIHDVCAEPPIPWFPSLDKIACRLN